jgi:hypothetical protein
MMRANTQTISIDAVPSKVVAFLADGLNLPRWAVGFARSVVKDGARWIVTTGSGEMPVRIESDAAHGVVDFRMIPEPGVEAIAATRVLPRGTGSEVVFTQFQGPGMPDDVFEKNVQAVSHELRVLKAVVEVECPL